MGPGTVWTGAENLLSTGVRSPDRPARSDSLYRLSYRSPQNMININHKTQSVVSTATFCRTFSHIINKLTKLKPQIRKKCKWTN